MIEDARISLTLINSEINDKERLHERTELLIDCRRSCGNIGGFQRNAYKLIRELNKELQSKGYLVVAGKVPKAFWETKFYGYNQPNQTA